MRHARRNSDRNRVLQVLWTAIALLDQFQQRLEALEALHPQTALPHPEFGPTHPRRIAKPGAPQPTQTKNTNYGPTDQRPAH